MKRILVDFGGYELRNIGDVAMLMVTVFRIRELFPKADIRVFTQAPERLRNLIPNVTPVSLDGRNQWGMTWNIFGALHKILPPSQHALLGHLESVARERYPTLACRWIDHRLSGRGHELSCMHAYLDEVRQADVVIAAGGGYITDSFEWQAISVFRMLRLAKSMGKPIAMFGQGLGPASSPHLLSWARRVLPCLVCLTLREGKFSLPFALRAGTDRQEIQITGDDAIMLAYARAPSAIGNAIGVNLRIATYSGIQQHDLEGARRILHQASAELDAQLLPIPISIHELDSDLVSIRVLLGDEAKVPTASFDTPEQVIEQIGRCRIVVTGSYHAAVFSLAQGVGVVAIVSSEYYRQKFEGLVEQFCGGCIIVDRRKPGFEHNLVTAIRDGWSQAEQGRDALLSRARLQLTASASAYARFKERLLEKGRM